MAAHGVDGETEPIHKGGGKVSDAESGRAGDITTSVVAVSKETTHRVGEDEWYTLGIHIITSLNTAFILGYPGLIMVYLGWTAGVLCLVGGAAISFYNNCLLGELHETGGKRHIRYRDLAGHVYGRHMYNTTWFLQYMYLFIGIIGSIILAGESLKAIATDFKVAPEVTLPGWVGVAGAVICIFACMIPNLHALRFFSTCSLLLSFIFTFIAIYVAFRDGVKDNQPRDYSLKGSPIAKTFNVLGALATIAFAFNTGILPEMQATVKEPSIRNTKKALILQFTVGTFPIVLLTFVGYWAYGNDVSPYMLNSASGPKSALTVANAAAFLQTVVALLIYGSPIYEFMDTYFLKKGSHEWSFHSVLVRFITRTTYMAISTFLGALLPFFGDFVALTGALAAFPLEAALVHHMYIKVKGKNFGKHRLAWHWSIVIVSAVLTVATSVAGLRFIIVDSINYHAFANI
ncbi:hypothetical protein M758_8G018700 [Ceratodon purpureus]|nr:hypothetical protein M758_8G018700 [Ceratodon purpureus]